MLHGIYMDCGVKLSPKAVEEQEEGAYGVGTSRWAYAAMRWLCSFKTSGQLVSWWTGGVEGDDGHRCSDTVCLDVEGGGGGGYWLSRALDRIQAKVWTSVKIWREGGREWSRENVCFTESECSRRGFFLCQTNNGNRCLTVRRKCGESFRQCLTEPGMTLLFLSNYTSSFTTPAVIINNALFLLLSYYTRRAFLYSQNKS